MLHAGIKKFYGENCLNTRKNQQVYFSNVQIFEASLHTIPVKEKHGTQILGFPKFVILNRTILLMSHLPTSIKQHSGSLIGLCYLTARHTLQLSLVRE